MRYRVLKNLVQSLLMHVLRALCTQGWVHHNSIPLCQVIFYLDFSIISQSLGKAQQHYPFLLVCTVFGIFNLCTDADAQGGCMGTTRLCIKSWLKDPLLRWGLKYTSVLCLAFQLNGLPAVHFPPQIWQYALYYLSDAQLFVLLTQVLFLISVCMHMCISHYYYY